MTSIPRRLAGLPRERQPHGELTAQTGSFARGQHTAAVHLRKRLDQGQADPAAATLRGRGISYCHYKGVENFLAMGMEVAVERSDSRSILLI